LAVPASGNKGGMVGEGQTYFHQYAADADPQDLLDPRNQVSTPWGGPDHGPCDKCGQSDRCGYRCLSCLEEGPRPDCPACGGRVEFEDVCPTCEGSGEITRTKRSGVSAFPSLAGLYRYLAEREADLGDGVILELEGRLSEDRDLDADSGAVLIYPTAVLARHEVDHGRLVPPDERRESRA
jgi:hypothetical protein